MKIIGIIPSRYASTRFPGKPLADIDGMPMIERVYRQALGASSLDDVIVATDDTRIEHCVKGFGGKVMRTSPDHQNGTERCLEVVSKLETTYDYAINIQGDEPFMPPENIDLLAEFIIKHQPALATLIKAIEDPEEVASPGVVKVIRNLQGDALYFSRAPIPFYRDAHQQSLHGNSRYFKHICLYGYRIEILKEIAKLPPTPLEKAESLEQLRWLEHGYTIKTVVTRHESIAIDYPEDINRALARIKPQP